MQTGHLWQRKHCLKKALPAILANKYPLPYTLNPKVSQEKEMTQVQMSSWIMTASLFSSLFLHAAVLFLFISIVLLPIGQVLASGILRQQNTPLVVLLGLALSPMLIGFAIALGLFLGLENIALRNMLWMFIALGNGLWVRGRHYLALFCPEVKFGGGISFLTFIFCFWVAVHPNGDTQGLHPGKIQQLGTSRELPPDNLLSYNFSRFIVQRIDPNKTEILPTWSVSDRGPLSGLVNAGIFLLLGLKETRPWLDATPELYFVYQGVMMFLNLGALFAVGLLGYEFFGRRVSGISIALITSSAFFYQNTIYTWPKAFATFYVLCAVCVFRRGPSRPGPGLVGALLAGSMLCHPLGTLYVLAFCVVIGVDWLIKRKVPFITLLREIGIVLGSLAIVYLPWALFKWFYVPPSSRMAYLNLFCRYDEAVTQERFSSVLSTYLEQHGLWEILQTKFTNFLYPFDITYLIEHFWYYLRHPWAVVPAISPLTFYQFLPAFGLLSSAVLILAVARRGRNLEPSLAWVFWTGWCSLLVVSLLFGCDGASVNHTWAYLAFFVSSLLVACELERMGKVLCFMVVVSNASVTTHYFYRAAGIQLSKLGSVPYLTILACLFVTILCLGLWQTLVCSRDIPPINGNYPNSKN